MLYSTAATIFLTLSSSLLAAAAPIPLKRAAKSGKSSGGGLTFPASVDDSGKAFGVKGNFKTKTSELRKMGDSAVLVAKYPKGSYAGSKGSGAPGIAGFIFSADGGADLKNAKEATFTYKVRFPEGFDFSLAGKLPGLFGGDNEQIAGKCAGGNHDDKCWSARLMWREQGDGELYGYFPKTNARKKGGPCATNDKCTVKYGASLGTGKWKFPTGDEYSSVTERVLLNDEGKFNGEIEVSINGDSKYSAKGLQLRTSDQGRITGAMIHTFFGGSSSPSFASNKNQEAYFKDFAIKVTKTLGGSGDDA